MCEECGVDLDSLLDNTSMDDMPDLLTLLSEMFGELAAAEPQDFMAEYRTEPDVVLTDLFEDNTPWRVAVAKMGGTDDVNRLWEPGEQFIINTYEDDVLTDSLVVDAVTKKSTQQVANEFAAHLFGYDVED